MNILITTEKGETRDIYFPEAAMEQFRKLGNVRTNEKDTALTEAELAEMIKDIDVCVTHWGSPRFTKAVLEKAGRLKLIAHAAGTVAKLVTDEVYERGIKVCSSNEVMARYVAEGALAYILAGLKAIPHHNEIIKRKDGWGDDSEWGESLIEGRIGLIGLGAVGRYLMDMLKPFDMKIRIFDPYITASALQGWQGGELASLEEVLAWGDVISVHASLTPETRHMIDAEKLKLIRDKALLVNTARGAVIDQEALLAELASGRIKAVLDVYEEEPLPKDSPFRRLGSNVTLMPHMAGSPVRERMTFATVDEIQRFMENKPLKFEIPIEKYRLMTR